MSFSDKWQQGCEEIPVDERMGIDDLIPHLNHFSVEDLDALASICIAEIEHRKKA